MIVKTDCETDGSCAALHWDDQVTGSSDQWPGPGYGAAVNWGAEVTTLTTGHQRRHTRYPHI